MKWEDVRERFPDEWVVIEATMVKSENGIRTIEELIVIDQFDDSPPAMHRYYELRRQNPNIEYGFFHTSRPELIFREKYIGVRGIR